MELGNGLASGLAVALVLAGVALLVTRLTNLAGDNSAEVALALQAGATVVDVRTPAEFLAGHVAGATNLPLDELPARAAELPTDRLVVVYCASGARSARAAAALRATGRTVVDAGTMAAFPPA